MSEPSLTLRNPHDQPIEQQAISIGVPFPISICPSVSELSLSTDGGEVHCHELDALEFWPDKSVKWVLLRAAVSLPANTEMRCTLSASLASEDQSVKSRLTVSESSTVIEVSNGISNFCFDSKQGFFPAATPDGDRTAAATTADLVLTDAQGDHCRFELQEQRIEQGTRGQIARITRCGHLTLAATERRILVEVNYTVYAGTGLLECALTVHNPSRALHQNGFWDLGDPGSIEFRALSVEMNGTSLHAPAYRLDDNHPLINVDDGAIEIFQRSSGGAQRESTIHVQADGSMPDLSSCCVVTGDQHSGEEIERASPIVSFGNEELSTTIALEHFWQNFPKSMRVEEGSFGLSLFPDISPTLHELQGGEKKTHRFFLQIARSDNALRWLHQPASITIDRDTVHSSAVFPYTSANHTDAEYDALLSLGLEGEHNFFAKREQVDEYGWRNFGELYADHEVWLYGVQEDFHSHYNNQYDPLAGFARQFALTGDQRWYELMHDLARHVLDIDLYHTDEDRVEYNRGYFWHTNHHVSANTCTHRTFSLSHQSELESHSTSGGPGDQHCYSTGFRYYYGLTGDRRAREAVLSITEWADKTINGSGNLIDGAIRFLRRGLRDGMQVMQGRQVFRYAYPLDRGTGNFIRALLNSYRLTGTREYLQRAEVVIENTFSATDDLDARNFDDIEGTWYYTVFLQDVADYLQVKRQEDDLDEHFLRILRGFFHYVDWMLEHEKPFLEQESKLEFVNNTWAAQDIRKANLFYVAYLLSTENRLAYLQKAQFFREYVIDTLKQSDTPWYTRIQAILHQNQGPNTLMYTESPLDPKLQGLEEVSIPDGYYTRLSFCLDYARGLCKRLMAFSPTKEINWVKSRKGKPV